MLKCITTNAMLMENLHTIELCTNFANYFFFVGNFSSLFFYLFYFCSGADIYMYMYVPVHGVATVIHHANMYV